MNDFFRATRDFLLDYLPRQRCFSQNTVRSYRQALNLFVLYLREQRGMAVSDLCFDLIDRDSILGFLDWLEDTRKCSCSTRNQRLMALRSFFRYAGQFDCAQMATYLTAQSIPAKPHEIRPVGFLSESALAALLQQPVLSSSSGLRNLVFMILMYDTAARCSELTNMKICDLKLQNPYPIAYLHGKGNKTRTVPLLPKTVQHCEQYLRKYHPHERTDSTKPLFYTVIHGQQQPMSTDTVEVFVKKYGLKAHTICPEMPEHVHPHMLRHTRAMHLYRQGMPMMLLSEYLGHANVETTKIYAYADTEMKRAYLSKVDAKSLVEPSATPIWVNDEEMILKLSGLR